MSERLLPNEVRRGSSSRVRALGALGAIAVLAVTGATLKDAKANQGPDFCPETPGNSQQITKEKVLEFEGSLPPGCDSVEQWLLQLQKLEDSGQVEGDGSTNKIQIGQ